MRDYILEVCADSVESAIAAQQGGANRLELCSNLIIGGTTPGVCLFQEIRKHIKIPVHVLIRPRFGDFCYTDYEYNIIKNEVKMYQELGAEGIVIGILRPDGTLNVEQMKELIELAEGMSVTLHRAFDVCADPYETMEQAITLGIDTILTSGQCSSCVDGTELLAGLVEKSQNRITIQVGSGVSAQMIRRMYEAIHTKAFHMSGKITINSSMEYRKEGVSMGLPAMSEYEIWQTDIKKIQAAKQVLEEI
jgi:copper homeostasis protein